MLRAAELYDMGKGHAPVAGGADDQTRWFLEAARFIRAERDHWEAELRDNHG